MAVTIRGVSTGGGASGGDFALSKPAGTVDGDDIYIFVNQEETLDSVSVSGFTKVREADASTTNRASLFYRKASGEGSSWTVDFAGGGSHWRAGLCVVLGGGHASNAPVVGNFTVSTGSGNTLDAPAITTPAANSMVVFFGAMRDGSLTISSQPAGMTQQAKSDNAYAAAGVQAAAGSTGAKSATLSGSSPNRFGIMVAVEPAPPSDKPSLEQLLGTATSKSSSATLVINPASKTVTVGKTIIVAVAADTNLNSPSATDNLGNTYTADKIVDNTGNVQAAVLRAPVTNGGALTTITINFDNAITAKAAVAGEFNNVGTVRLTDGAFGTAIGSTSFSDRELWIGAFGAEDPSQPAVSGTTGTPAQTKVAAGGANTSGQGATSNIGVTLAYIAIDGNSSANAILSTNSTGVDFSSAGVIYNAAGPPAVEGSATIAGAAGGSKTGRLALGGSTTVVGAATVAATGTYAQRGQATVAGAATISATGTVGGGVEHAAKALIRGEAQSITHRARLDGARAHWPFHDGPVVTPAGTIDPVNPHHDDLISGWPMFPSALSSAGASLGPRQPDSSLMIGAGGLAQTGGFFDLPVGAEPRTFILMFQRDAGGVEAGTILSYGTSGTTRQSFGMKVVGDTTLEFWSWGDDHQRTVPDVGGDPHVMAAVYDGATTVRLYLDGQQAGADIVLGGALNTIDNGAGLVLGVDYFGTSNRYEERLDDVLVFPSALSAAQIAEYSAWLLSQPIMAAATRVQSAQATLAGSGAVAATGSVTSAGAAQLAGAGAIVAAAGGLLVAGQAHINGPTLTVLEDASVGGGMVRSSHGSLEASLVGPGSSAPINAGAAWAGWDRFGGAFIASTAMIRIDTSSLPDGPFAGSVGVEIFSGNLIGADFTIYLYAYDWSPTLQTSDWYDPRTPPGPRLAHYDIAPAGEPTSGAKAFVVDDPAALAAAINTAGQTYFSVHSADMEAGVDPGFGVVEELGVDTNGPIAIRLTLGIPAVVSQVIAVGSTAGLHEADALLAGAATVSPAGRLVARGQATAAGQATLSASAFVEKRAQATLAGSSAGTKTAKVERFAQAALAGSATIAADGTIVGFPQGNATLAGLGQLNATGRAIFRGQAAIAGAATISALGGKLVPAAATISAAGAVAAGGVNQKLASALVAAQGAVSASAAVGKPGSATLAGLGAISALARLLFGGLATLSGQGALSGQGRLIHGGMAVIIGLGQIIAASTRIRLPEPRLIRVDVYDRAGNRLGYGPLVGQLAAEYGQDLDQLGYYAFDIPATLENADLLEPRRIVWIYREGEGLVFRGVVETLELRERDAGAVLSVGGRSIVAELADRKMYGREWEGASLATVASDLVSGTSVAVGSLDVPASTLTMRGDGVSRWAAAVKASQQFGIHAREDVLAGSGGAMDISAFGAVRPLLLRNVEIIDPELSDNPDIGIVTEVSRSIDASGIINRVYALGAGEGNAQLHLGYSDRAAPYTRTAEVQPDGRTLYYIEDGPSVAAYGRVDQFVTVKEALPLANSASGFTAMGNALYDIAVDYMTGTKDPITTYAAKATGLRHLDGSGAYRFEVGDKLGLWYTGIAHDEAGPRLYLNVNAQLWLMGYQRRFRADGSDDWTLKVATADRAPQDGAAKLSRAIEDFYAIKVAQRPYSYMAYHGPFRDSLAPSFPMPFVVEYDANVFLLHSAKLQFRVRGLRANTTTASAGGSTSPTTSSGGGQTSSTGTSHTHSVSGTTSGGGGSHGHSVTATTSANPNSFNLYVTGLANGIGGFIDYVTTGVSHNHSSATTDVASGHSHTVSGGTSTFGPHDHGISANFGNAASETHTHGVSGQSANTSSDHSHSVSGSTSGGEASHTHSISAHTHSVTIPDHTHGLVYGIFQQSTPGSPGITISINGVDRTAALGGPWNAGAVLDITQYLVNANGQPLRQDNAISLGAAVLCDVEVVARSLASATSLLPV